MPLLEVQSLSVHFPIRPRLFGRTAGWVKAVDDVSLTVEAGEAVGLVGESGCGKTTLGRAVVRLVEPTAGSIRFEGEDLGTLPAAALRSRRRRIQMIFQDPFGSLDPRLTVGASLAEALDLHGLAPGRDARPARIASLLEAVGLERAHADRYPHEFSGGQRQRIGIARALAVEPRLVVCDEPVSALDVSVQAQVVNLLQDLQRDRGIAYLFISHDLAVVEHLCRRIVVMYLGRVVEAGPTSVLCRSPLHPYTQALLAAVPTLRPPDPAPIPHPAVPPAVIPPEPGGDARPEAASAPAGCPFLPRCPRAEARCRHERPGLREVAPGHSAACHLAA